MPPKAESCEFNVRVGCNGGNCRRCGWNPKVGRRRVRALREAMRPKEPEGLKGVAVTWVRRKK